MGRSASTMLLIKSYRAEVSDRHFLYALQQHRVFPMQVEVFTVLAARRDKSYVWIAALVSMVFAFVATQLPAKLLDFDWSSSAEDLSGTIEKTRHIMHLSTEVIHLFLYIIYLSRLHCDSSLVDVCNSALLLLSGKVPCLLASYTMNLDVSFSHCTINSLTSYYPFLGSLTKEMWIRQACTPYECRITLAPWNFQVNTAHCLGSWFRSLR